MKSLSLDLVAKVRSGLSGARLAKFDASVSVLNESLAQGAWTSRGRIKAHSGFYQGLVKRLGYRGGREQDAVFGLEMSLCFGRGMEGKVQPVIETLRAGRDSRGNPIKLKVSDELIHAWVALCNEQVAAVAALDKARPVAVITPIGLSPKVTMTLTQCNLDLDLPTIRMAELVPKKIPARDKKGNLLVDSKGKQLMETIYVVKWSAGIAHNMSRFISGCQACGKNIPSGRYAAIEVKDKKSGKLISMWLGLDCAANIFGVKDIGVERS